MSRVTKIRQNNAPQDDEGYDFGATFDNVTYDYTDNNGVTKRFTLTHLYNYLKNFFDNGTFVMYSKKKPKDPRVKIWYQYFTDDNNS